MPEAAKLAALRIGAVIAPAGHGKTEMIAKTAKLGRRALILTHTHAGVHALRSRLKRLGVPHSAACVDTIAGWAMRYCNAFPKRAQAPVDMPATKAEWLQLYAGSIKLMELRAAREVIDASYDRVLIDEYQDCNIQQHAIAQSLAALAPTIIFGDPMQGIFEFAEANLSWQKEIFPRFPLALELREPRRWETSNPELGVWIADARERLLAGERIDLCSGPITYMPCADAFEMGPFFDGLDSKEGSIAAIHCRREMCNRLAKATGGAYKAIEEIAAKRLRQFASVWDGAINGEQRVGAITALLDDCFQKKKKDEEIEEAAEDAQVLAELNAAALQVAKANDLDAVRSLLGLSRRHPRWRLFRNELWRDAERAFLEVASGRAPTLSDAVSAVRQRLSLAGRQLPLRTISTPLLLKGLEFEHVLVPDATHFCREDKAQAKLFYVAISRATKSLTISSSSRYLQFPRPTL